MKNDRNEYQNRRAMHQEHVTKDANEQAQVAEQQRRRMENSRFCREDHRQNLRQEIRYAETEALNQHHAGRQ